MSRQQVSDATRALLQQIRQLESQLQDSRDALQESQEKNVSLRLSVTRYGESVRSLEAQLSPEARAEMLESARLRLKVKRLEERLVALDSFHGVIMDERVAEAIAGIEHRAKERAAMQLAAALRAHEAKVGALGREVSEKDAEIAALRRQLLSRDAELAEVRKLLPDNTVSGSFSRPGNRSSFAYASRRPESRAEFRNILNERSDTPVLPAIPH